MTTAYTSLLGLALPVTGELSGTWGDTVNNSITSLLDSAIAGTTTLSVDADVTLTTTTGAANTSREAIILWTAGGTITRNITAPAQSKTYIVINKSSSTQSIVLRGAGPTTGVTIVQGEAAVCAWNGSDFIKVSNISGSGTFTDLTVTGNTTLGDASTDTVTVNGYMGVGGAANIASALTVGSPTLSGTTQRGIDSATTFGTGATTSVQQIRAITTLTAAGVYAEWIGLNVNQPQGAGYTLTNAYGVYINDQTKGTNNYGIRTLVSSGTNKWNIYASGTADNYFAGKVGIGTNAPAVTLAISATDAVLVPSGTTAQRPTGAAGYIRYNSTTGQFEGYTTAWGAIGGGATGGGGEQVFWENETSVDTSYTITAGKNAGTFGPVTVASGVTVTVPSGSVWSVV